MENELGLQGDLKGFGDCCVLQCINDINFYNLVMASLKC